MAKVIHLQDETYWELMNLQNKLQTEERQRITADEMVKRLMRWASMSGWVKKDER